MEHKKAITDLINFIAEFELWLEAKTVHGEKPRKWDMEAIISHEVLWEVLDKYRECKKRIQYHE